MFSRIIQWSVTLSVAVDKYIYIYILRYFKLIVGLSN